MCVLWAIRMVHERNKIHDLVFLLSQVQHTEISVLAIFERKIIFFPNYMQELFIQTISVLLTIRKVRENYKNPPSSIALFISQTQENVI